MNFMDPRMPARFWAKAIPEPNSGCWLWLGSRTRDGHAILASKAGTRYAHRQAWISLHGPVPLGLELDHLCMTSCCVNPRHLQPVTHAENVRRGRAGHHQSAKTHCPRGHAYDATNTYHAAPCASRTQKNRQCRMCKCLLMRGYRAEKVN